MKRIFFIVLTVLIVVLGYLDYRNYRHEGLGIGEQLANPVEKNAITALEITNGIASITMDASSDAYIIIPFQEQTYFWKHLDIEYEEMTGVRKVEVYYKFRGDSGFSIDQKVALKRVEKDANHIYWNIPPGEYEALRIDFEGEDGAEAVISDLRIHDFSYLFRGQAYFYVLACLILFLLIFPGSALFAVFSGRDEGAVRYNLLLFFCLSLLFYLVLYLVLVASQKFGGSPGRVVPLAFGAGVAALCAALTLRGRWRVFWSFFLQERLIFIFSICLVLISSLFVTRFSVSPFEYESVNHNTVDQQTIFSRFGGHDNMFQFVNGKAIADDEPFSKYYGGKKLFYDVQDRGILPGVIYAVFRTILSAPNSYIGESYLTYTLFGLCMNVMVVFPLAVLFRRYFPERFLLPFFLVLCLNTYVFPNFYFTWFKFSGAALFLSGLIVLLEKRGAFLAWCYAGMVFGLACSMHAGNALAYPLVFLWLMAWNAKDFGIFSRQVLLYPATLFGVFVLVNIPWSVVKNIYFPDTHALIRQHYLPGSKGGSLLECFINFHKTHPLSEQLQTRVENLVIALRLEDLAFCQQLLADGEYRKFVKASNNWQFFFAIFSVGPLLCIALLAKLLSAVGNLFVRVKKDVGEKLRGSQAEMVGLLLVSLLTVIGMVFVYYGDDPDVNHQHPPGSTLIVHSMLIGIALKSGKAGQLLLAVYAIFSLWRMYLYSILYIFV